MNIELKPGVDWVGYVDWNIRDFHSFNTYYGATYNSYLIRDEKTALIDTVKGPFVPDLMENIRNLVNLNEVDYVICNHAEPDHAGALPGVLRMLPNATLICNAKCRDVLAGYFNISDWKIKTVTPDESLSLGTRSLRFMNTPMVHWPDSMFTYVPEEKLLFSMDAFGQHLATSVRFDDEWSLEAILNEAKTYYANIVAPYGRQVLQTLEAASKFNVGMIAPSHGLIWRKNIPAIVNAYTGWASGKCKPKILIVYDTMWESTQIMADSIVDGILNVSQTLDVQLLHVRRNSLTRIATEILDAACVAFGSATLNTQMMPMMSSVLTYIRGLKFSKKTALAFGSSGWGPGGAEQIDKWFEEMQWETVTAPIRSRWRPTQGIKEQCFEAGKLLAHKALTSTENV